MIRNHHSIFKAFHQWYFFNIVCNLKPIEPKAWNMPIFIHIPKAAGSSVTHMPIYYRAGHKDYRWYESRMPKHIHSPLFFCIVRNPFDRLASAYKYLSTGGNSALDFWWARTHISKYQDIETFITQGLERVSILKWLHFRPQIDFIISTEGKISVDTIIHFEKLSEEWAEFSKERGLPNNLPIMNVSPKHNLTAPLSRHAREIVERVYKKDFEILGYDLKSN